MKSFISFIASIFIFYFCFVFLNSSNINIGKALDWILGFVSMWWLVFITKYPWNMYFKAKSVVVDGERSLRDNININSNELDYSKKVVKVFLRLSIGLHILSSIIFLLISFFKISPIGYAGFILALLLTCVRPLLKYNEYVINRLTSIQTEFTHPRNDVNLLRSKIEELKSKEIHEIKKDIKEIESIINIQDEHSRLSRILSSIKNLEKMTLLLNNKIDTINQKIEETNRRIDENNLKNKEDFTKMLDDFEYSVSKVSEDLKIHSHVKGFLKFLRDEKILK